MNNNNEAQEFAKDVQQELCGMSDVEKFLTSLECEIDIDLHIGDDECEIDPDYFYDDQWDIP